MKYHAVIDGQERLIELVAEGSLFRISVHPESSAGAEGAKKEPQQLVVDALHLHPLALSVLANGRSWSCDLEPGKGDQGQGGPGGNLAVRVNQGLHRVELLDERTLRMRRAGGKFSLDGPQRVDAPMPGKVVRVMVKKGDAVTEGQGLVIVEAMKMENELKSPKAGVVSELFAVEGAAVENGAKLVVIS